MTVKLVHFLYVVVGVRHIGAAVVAQLLVVGQTASHEVRAVAALTITVTLEPLCVAGVALMGFASLRSLCNEYIIRCY